MISSAKNWWFLLYILLIGYVVWLIFTLNIALILIIVLLLGWVILEIRSRAYLQKWLNTAGQSELPNGFGLWREIYTELIRLQKRSLVIQKDLAHSAQKFRNSLSMLPIAVVILNERYQIEWANPITLEILGINPKSDVGLPIQQLIREPSFIAMIESQNRNISEIPLKITTINNKHLSLNLLSYNNLFENSPTVNKNHKDGLGEYLLLAQDVSHIESANLMLRDFVANVSHELRTPLTVIRGYSEIFTEVNSFTNSQIIENAGNKICSEAMRMERLINDLLFLSRLEGANLANFSAQRPQQWIDMKNIFTILKEKAQELAKGKQTINFINRGAKYLFAYEDEILSAFINLLTNAITYTPIGSEINVYWLDDDILENSHTTNFGKKSAVFRIHDNGKGIAPEHIKRLTERFYRVDESHSRTSDTIGGTGLGLSIVNQVAIRHKAQLIINSTLGVGSEFSLVFPTTIVKN